MASMRWTPSVSLEVVVDLFLAVIGLTVLILPAVSLVNELLSEPLSFETITRGVVFLSLFIAPFFSAGYLSLARLRDACIALLASGLVLVVTGAFALAILGVEIDSPVPRAIAWTLAYCVAVYVFVTWPTRRTSSAT